MQINRRGDAFYSDECARIRRCQSPSLNSISWVHCRYHKCRVRDPFTHLRSGCLDILSICLVGKTKEHTNIDIVSRKLEVFQIVGLFHRILSVRGGVSWGTLGEGEAIGGLVVTGN